MKTCTVCHEVKPLAKFYKSKNMKDGHFNQCRDCMLAYQRAARKESRHKNLEHHRKRDREYKQMRRDKGIDP